MSDQPQIHIGVIKRRGAEDELTANWSRIPSTAGQGLFDQMEDTTRMALEALRRSLQPGQQSQTKAFAGNPAAFAPAELPKVEACPECGSTNCTKGVCVDCGLKCEKCGAEVAHKIGVGPTLCEPCHKKAVEKAAEVFKTVAAEGGDPFAEDQASEAGDEETPLVAPAVESGLPATDAPTLSTTKDIIEEPDPFENLSVVTTPEPEQAPAQEPVVIPGDDETKTSSVAIGLSIPFPPEEWTREPITETNTDGTPGGQLKAVNAALTSMGYGGAKRHQAAQAILDSYGEIHGQPVTRVTSIKDLTKADANTIMSFCERAGPQHLAELFKAIGGKVAA